MFSTFLEKIPFTIARAQWIPDDDAADELVAGADDKIFRLDRADLEECRSLVTDREELAEMRRKR